MQYQSDNFSDPVINFNNGVAAIDIITLVAAAKAVEPHTPHQSVKLPELANNDGGSTFDELMQITVDPEKPSARAVIDTKKMTWEELCNPQKSKLTDYAGLLRQAVSFSNAEVARVEGVQVTHLPLKLYDGRPAVMWFAEMSLDNLQSKGYYDLFDQAKMFTAKFSKSNPEPYDQVLIPAQQIDYQRSMSEIVQMNVGELEDVQQKFKIALDESGARVYVETAMLAARSVSQPTPEPKIAIFGKQGPVMFWLTEPDSQKELIPFAVVATTSEAWLDPNLSVNFDFNTEADTDEQSAANSTAVISEDEAKRLAGNTLGVDVTDDSSAMVLIPAKTYPDGWLFFIQARDYIENGNQGANVRGGGQLLVLNDGTTYGLGSGFDWGAALESETAKQAVVEISKIRNHTA